MYSWRAKERFWFGELVSKGGSCERFVASVTERERRERPVKYLV
jgi:hypothetical protein